MTPTTPLIAAEELTAPSESQTRLVLRRFARHRMAMLSLAVLLLLFLISIIIPIVVEAPRIENTPGQKFIAPLARDAAGTLHLLGTDNLGRDYFVRLLYAARVSLTIAVTVSAISAVVGMTLGLLAGYFGGWLDMLIRNFLEFVSTFPLLVVLLILMAILLQSEEQIPIPAFYTSVVAAITAIPDHEAKKIALVIVALALLLWTTTARLMRGMVLSVREQAYIEASRALGASNLRLILKHVFPNAFPPLIVDFTLQLNNVLVLESALSFLGFGVQDPTPTWGNMLAAAQSHMFSHPWMPLVPGLPILLASLAINFVGDGLRDALDPRLKL